MHIRSKFFALGAVVALGTAFASADVITFGSGASTTFVSETGSNAPAGITPYNGGFFPGPSQPGNGSGAATVLTTPVTPTWSAALGSSSWVSYAQTGPGGSAPTAPNGNYWFQQTFTTLAGNNYVGQINVLADDTVIVFLNGHQENTPTDPMGYPHCSAGAPSCINPITGTPITLNTADFVDGTNTLTFQLVQGGGSYLGLDFYAAAITGTPRTTPTVPEPSTLVLLGTGLFGAAGTMLRRLRN